MSSSRPRAVSPAHTDALYKVLKAFDKLSREKGYSPTYDEICAEIGLKSKSAIHFQFAKAKKMGLLEYEFKKPRASRLTPKGKYWLRDRTQTERMKEDAADLY